VDYLAKNPCGSIPMIVDQECQLMGNVNTFVYYLTATKQKLHSYMPREHETKIDQYLNWYLSVMKPSTQRLIKVIVGPKAFGHELYPGDEVEAAKLSFLNDILKRVELLFDNRDYLITAIEPTVIDIIFYHEISTALMLTRIKNFKGQFPRLSTWIKNMGDIHELNEQEIKLVKVIEDYQLE